MRFRIRYESIGGHTHCRLFASETGADGTWHLAGRFSLRNGEFTSFRQETPSIQYLPEPWQEVRENTPIEEAPK